MKLRSVPAAGPCPFFFFVKSQTHSHIGIETAHPHNPHKGYGALEGDSKYGGQKREKMCLFIPEDSKGPGVGT